MGNANPFPRRPDLIFAMKPHRARILAMQAVFQGDFQPSELVDLQRFEWIDFKVPEDEKKMASEIIAGVREMQKEIDSIIVEYSENWEFERISAVSKAILRISIYQLMAMLERFDAKVTIDEAIRLAKEYAEPDAYRFINGILDSYYHKRIATSPESGN